MANDSFSNNEYPVYNKDDQQHPFSSSKGWIIIYKPD